MVKWYIFIYIDNKIQSEGLQSMSENLIYITNISKLGLKGNELGDNGMKILSENLGHIVNLVELNLQSIN